jgi:hypothetical protein
MFSDSPKAGLSRKPPSCSAKLFPEQIRISIVYHAMKLFIFGLIALALLSAAHRLDCFGQWRTETRERAIEAREEARARAREFREQQRQDLRAWRDSAREQRDRMREEMDQAREAMRDWRYTY